MLCSVVRLVIFFGYPSESPVMFTENRRQNIHRSRPCKKSTLLTRNSHKHLEYFHHPWQHTIPTLVIYFSSFLFYSKCTFRQLIYILTCGVRPETALLHILRAGWAFAKKRRKKSKKVGSQPVTSSLPRFFERGKRFANILSFFILLFYLFSLFFLPRIRASGIQPWPI